MPLSLRLLLLTIIGRQHQALTLAYALMRAERDYYRERYWAIAPKDSKLKFTPVWRRTFGVLGKAVGWSELRKIATVASIRTFQRWYRLTSEAPTKLANKVGRPKVPAWVETLIVLMAKQTTWGITRIAGAIRNVWKRIDPNTVRRILREHHMDPDRRKLTTREATWKPFITENGDRIAAMDFFQTQIWDWLGKHTIYVLFIIHIKTRRVEIAGITEHPTAQWMKQVARNLTMDGVGFCYLNNCRHLIRDNDEIYQPSFDEMFRTRCVGEGGLRRALREFLEHYHKERNHQGIGNVLIDPEKLVADESLPIRCRRRLGGALKYYYRDAA